MSCSVNGELLWPIMLQSKPHCHTVSGYSDTYLLYLLANIVDLLSQILVYKTLKCLTFNLTYTVSHGTHGTHVVIYMPVFTKNEDTELSLGLFMKVAI